MNDLTTIDYETRNISEAAQDDAGFQKMLKYKKGDYWCDGHEVPLGTQVIAHCIGWVKAWIKFENRTVIERKLYRVARGERAPERDELPDKDQQYWGPGLDGRPADPWTLQYLLPMENLETGEQYVFIGSSFGGRRAVGELCSAYARRRAKDRDTGQPIVELQSTTMPTRNYGHVKRPIFEIVSWGSEHEPVEQISKAVSAKNEMDDDIPF